MYPDFGEEAHISVTKLDKAIVANIPTIIRITMIIFLSHFMACVCCSQGIGVHKIPLISPLLNLTSSGFSSLSDLQLHPPSKHNNKLQIESI